MGACTILKHKDGDQFLVPFCYEVLSQWHRVDIDDKQIIKEFCTCDRDKKEKYETKSRDEVFVIISKLKDKMRRYEAEISEMKEEIDLLQTEVFCLNTVEIYQEEKQKK